MRHRLTLALALGLLVLLARPASAQSFAGHIDAVKAALEKGELRPGQWIRGTDRCESLRSTRGVQLDLAPFGWASGFTMRLDAPSADDALVAAGVALANGLPSLYLVRKRNDLPWFLREAERAYPAQIAVIEGDDPLAVLKARAISLRGGSSSQALREPDCDAFIGSVLSKETDLQLAEARAVLREIETGLREYFRDASVFCESLQYDPTRPATPAVAVCRDLAAIRNSRRCVFYVHTKEPRHSGMWVEAGVALALERPTVILVPSLDVLPPSLRRAHPTGSARVYVYASHRELIEQLRKDPSALLSL